MANGLPVILSGSILAALCIEEDQTCFLHPCYYCLLSLNLPALLQFPLVSLSLPLSNSIPLWGSACSCDILLILFLLHVLPFLPQLYSIPIDVFTFCFLLFNLAMVGTLAVFFCRMPIFLTQAYLVAIGAIVAFWFSHLPEWTTWTVLIAMALYDLYAVLTPRESIS